MILHVTEATYSHDYIIRLRFNNVAEGEVDLADELDGKVFELLRDIETFKSFKVDSILQTIVWENGADLASEFLYENPRIVV